MSITAFVVPGLNSLLHPESRVRFERLPRVRERLRDSEAVLAEEHGIKASLRETLRLPTRFLFSRENVHLAAVATLAVQVGVAESIIEKTGPPGCVVGCSLGDVTRAMIAGACDLSSAIRILRLVRNEALPPAAAGSNAALIARESSPFSGEDLRWLDANEVDASQLSPRLLNVSGSPAGLALLRSRAWSRRWKLVALMDYPVHSRQLLLWTPAILEGADRIPISDSSPGVRVWSTQLVREISREYEFREELDRSLVSPHHWHRSALELIDGRGVGKFVNLGPCRTLSRLIRELPRPVEMVEPEELGIR